MSLHVGKKQEKKQGKAVWCGKPSERTILIRGGEFGHQKENCLAVVRLRKGGGK